MKRLVICLNFEGDSVEHFSVTPDGLDDRGAFQFRNAPPSGFSCSIPTPSPSALAFVTNLNFLDPEIAASKSGKA